MTDNSKMKSIPFSVLKVDMLDNVLRAIDKTACDALGVTMPDSVMLSGWKDADIPALAAAVDVQARVLSDRINCGTIPNTHGVRILMDK